MSRPLKVEADLLRSEIDLVAWGTLQNEYESKYLEFGGQRLPLKEQRCEQNYAKFFDLDQFIPYHLRLVRLIGLDQEAEPKKVMDIGCGAGIFLYLCQAYGHAGLGLEVNAEMYLRMAEVLGVEMRVSPVFAFKEQPEELTGFDWITAIAIKFDRLDWGPQSPEQWRLEEWQFFLRDMAKRVNDDGKIFLKPNHTVKPSEAGPGYLFKDDRIEPYLESISRFRTETEFIIPKENIV